MPTMAIHLAVSLSVMKPAATSPSPGPRLFSGAATAQNAITLGVHKGDSEAPKDDKKADKKTDKASESKPAAKSEAKSDSS